MIILTRRVLLGTMLQAQLRRHVPHVVCAKDLDDLCATIDAGTVVIVDGAGVAPHTGFEVIARLTDGWPSNPAILLTDRTSDLLLHCARRAGACTVASVDDEPAIICELAVSVAVGRFRVSAMATPSADKRFLPRLTERRVETYLLASRGHPDEHIAAQLGVTIATAETHRTHTMERLGVHSYAELVRHALRHGIYTVEQLVSDHPVRRCTRVHQPKYALV